MTHPNNADKKQRHVFLSDAKTTCCQVPSIMERDSESNGYDRPRRYENEDVTPTSDRELKGWYAYGLAAEVFAVAGVGSFLPVTLEQLAKERGVLRSDHVTPCVKPKSVAAEAQHLLLRAVSRATNDKNESQCVIQPFGKDISTASFAMYTFSIAVLVQAIVLISFSSFADHGTYRKKLLLAFGCIGSISSMLFIVVSPSIYLLGSVLVILGVASLGSSFVLLNSFLPLLASNHPSVISAERQEWSPSATVDMVEPDGSYSPAPNAEHTNPSRPQDSKQTSPALALSNKISAKGVGLGYMAAVLVQIISIGMLLTLNKVNWSSQSIPLRVILLMVGICWAAGGIPGALWLRDRPGPPLKSLSGRHGKVGQVLAYFRFAWSSVWQTVKQAVKLRQTVIFLIAWFLLSDSIATVSGTAILFARTELKMSTVQIAILSITATSSGIAGAFTWPVISRRYQLHTQQTIIGCVLLMEIIPIYGLIGYLPFVQSWGVGGLQQAWEIYPLGVVHGFVMGGLSSYCRSFYGLLIPPGSEAAFYALYAVTDKGSSAIGPAIVGMIVDVTGTIRPAFAFLAVLIALPIPLIYIIDTEKGRADALAMAGVRSKPTSYNSDARDRESYDEDAQPFLSQHE
ncbi:MFS general substrate transporter [Aureobasidium pullulans]|nr:MFS general substrate transporter [Aureobasidium pullulans]